MTEAIQIRLCQGIEEMRRCVELQREVWGFSDLDLVPLRLFVVAEKVGGQVIGAFDSDELVGFAMSVPGNRKGQLYLHSHMLGVRESHRNSGLGRRIKLYQREDALRRGIELIEWTFDPLEIKNSWLNIVKLGAIARRYNINQYGITSSPLSGFLPTDRLIAEWWLRSKRVEAVVNGGPPPGPDVELRIEVPAQIYAWKASETERGRAAEVQSRNRELLLEGFGRGLAVLGYERDASGNGAMLVGKWDEDWSYAGD